MLLEQRRSPNGINGVSISSSPSTNNVIGGTAPGAGNLISGNQRGSRPIRRGTIIQGNLIGTDVTGTQKDSQSNRYRVREVRTYLIGGLTPAPETLSPVMMETAFHFGGNGSKLQGNYIGTDITGTFALGNGSSGVVAGDECLIGGTVPEARNVIAGNCIANVGVGSFTRFEQFRIGSYGTGQLYRH